jgi:hypothetical protein
MSIAEHFLKARRCGVPLLGIETPDQAATMKQLVAALNGKGNQAALSWDIVRGLLPVTESAREEVKRLAPDETAALNLINPTEVLNRAMELKPKSVLFLLNAHRYYDNDGVMQAIWNLRDPFKSDGRMLVLMGPTLRLPMELERDIIVLDEPLPSDDELASIIRSVYGYAALAAPSADKMQQLVRAVRGLAAFPAEQAIAMSLEKDGAQVSRLWELKRKMIEQTRGLTLYNGGETFADIGGIERVKRFGTLLFSGSQPPAAIIFVDEIEKAIAGSSGVGDSSGTSQDQLGVLLSAMQDHEWSGMIAVGPPGCAKSMYAKALGNTFGVPTIRLDLGAMKGSLVGQSEQQVRAAIKIINSVAGSSAHWVATCNRLDTLPPELRRRFTDGIWFFDLPDETERAAIWKMLLAKYAIQDTELPDDDGWTGADIRNVCSIAYRLRCSLKEAATYITPVSKSDPASIERLRKLADGSFLSASYPGVYERSRRREEEGRRVHV